MQAHVTCTIGAVHVSDNERILQPAKEREYRKAEAKKSQTMSVKHVRRVNSSCLRMFVIRCRQPRYLVFCRVRVFQPMERSA